MSGYLVTGGCGFAGSHLVDYLLKQGHQVTVLDSLTYAGSLENLRHLPPDNLHIVHQDLSEPFDFPDGIEYVIHNAAASHVLRSLKDPGTFVRSNVIGTFNLLDAIARKPVGSIRKLVYVSTDEVFGPSMPHTGHTAHEDSCLKPTNPYSASKAAGEFLTYSYFRSFNVPAIITRTVNMFGERQHPEKFVPLIISHVLEGKRLDIHSANGEIGSRCWLHAGDQARGLAYLAEHGIPGQSYHIAAGRRFTNLEMAQMVAGYLGKTLSWKFKEYSWTGHDFSYAMHASAQSIHWLSSFDSFTDQLFNTVKWYQFHPELLFS